jgi:hypothetical protein
MFYRIHQGWTSDKVHAEKEMDLKKVGPLRLFALKKLCPQDQKNNTDLRDCKT